MCPKGRQGRRHGSTGSAYGPHGANSGTKPAARTASGRAASDQTSGAAKKPRRVEREGRAQDVIRAAPRGTRGAARRGDLRGDRLRLLLLDRQKAGSESGAQAPNARRAPGAKQKKTDGATRTRARPAPRARPGRRPTTRTTPRTSTGRNRTPASPRRTDDRAPTAATSARPGGTTGRARPRAGPTTDRGRARERQADGEGTARTPNDRPRPATRNHTRKKTQQSTPAGTPRTHWTGGHAGVLCRPVSRVWFRVLRLRPIRGGA